VGRQFRECDSGAANTSSARRGTELAGLVNDASLSRILAGIHYRFDMVAGGQLGRAVAEWAIALGAP